MIVKNINVSINGKHILDNLSFSLGTGEKIGLVGVNGSGKSTLLKALSGVIDIDLGIINLNGSKVSYLRQEIPHEYDEYSIIDYIKFETGIDNLDYSNDSGLIQISVTGTEIFEQGDIKPVSIKLLDGTTVVYDTTNPGNRQAIIPGKKYKIVYTAQYVGDSLYYKRFDGTNWVNDTSRPYKSTVPLSYSITRKVGNAQSNDGVTKTAYFVDSANSTTITMAKDKIFTYTINDVMLEHPYLDTSFTVTSTNNKINKDTHPFL